MAKSGGWQPVDKIDCARHSILPEGEGEGGMIQQSQCRLDDVTMLALGDTILLVGMGTGKAMNHTTARQVGGEGAVLATPIALKIFDA